MRSYVPGNLINSSDREEEIHSESEPSNYTQSTTFSFVLYPNYPLTKISGNNLTPNVISKIHEGH